MYDIRDSGEARLTPLCWLVLRALQAPSSATITILIYGDIITNAQHKSKLHEKYRNMSIKNLCLQMTLW